jgi:hypothetical protein
MGTYYCGRLDLSEMIGKKSDVLSNVSKCRSDYHYFCSKGDVSRINSLYRVFM